MSESVSKLGRSLIKLIYREILTVCGVEIGISSVIED